MEWGGGSAASFFSLCITGCIALHFTVDRATGDKEVKAAAAFSKRVVWCDVVLLSNIEHISKHKVEFSQALDLVSVRTGLSSWLPTSALRLFTVQQQGTNMILPAAPKTKNIQHQQKKKYLSRRHLPIRQGCLCLLLCLRRIEPTRCRTTSKHIPKPRQHRRSKGTTT